MATVTRSEFVEFLHKSRIAPRAGTYARGQVYGSDGNTFTDLSGLDLSQLDLSHLDFVGCDMKKTNLTNSVLVGAALQHIDGAIVKGAKFYSAGEKPATIYYCSNTDFTGATLNYDVIQWAVKNGSTFPDLNLSGMDFSGKLGWFDNDAVLPRVNLTNTILRSTLLLNVTMRGAILDGTDISPSGVSGHLAESDWQGCDLSGSVVRNRTVLDHGLFNSTKWVGAKFESVTMVDTHFNGSDWRNVVFGRNVLLRGVSLVNSDLRGADLSLAVVPDWSSINLYRAVMDKSTKMPLGFQPHQHFIEWK